MSNPSEKYHQCPGAWGEAGMSQGSQGPLSDPFRIEYRKLTDADRQAIDTVKMAAKALLDAIVGSTSVSREGSLAITKLEECVMWATKAITRE